MTKAKLHDFAKPLSVLHSSTSSCKARRWRVEFIYTKLTSEKCKSCIFK